MTDDYDLFSLIDALAHKTRQETVAAVAAHLDSRIRQCAGAPAHWRE